MQLRSDPCEWIVDGGSPMASPSTTFPVRLGMRPRVRNGDIVHLAACGRVSFPIGPALARSIASIRAHEKFSPENGRIRLPGITPFGGTESPVSRRLFRHEELSHSCVGNKMDKLPIVMDVLTVNSSAFYRIRCL